MVKSSELKRIAKLATDSIMAIYRSDDLEIELKSDESPITKADKEANDIICKELEKRYSDIPILSEESKITSWEERRHWKSCFIVDPIDGTKEFIKKNDEFTINIAYYDCEEQRILESVVYAPALGIMYYTQNGKAFRELNGEVKQLPCEKTERFTVVASHSHLNEETKRHIESLKKDHPDLEIKRVGSSLKFCLVAEGSADYYPRLGPMNEWDSAAGQCLIEAAGGHVLDLKARKPLLYNKQEFLNSHFLAFLQKKS